ncbi:MAG: heme ABC transporter ATP-binding protein [Pseudoalteromonas sp.]|uniref:heme ABC transporter ATP-binding protein n=1 Tax=unclassified Pseudoalteromonas TaxID=194690 RepID=UPI003F9AACEF
MLSGKNLTAKVGSKVLLDDVDFVVHPQEVVVIIGPNGAGKSSLLKTLCGDIPFASGSITLDHKSLCEYSITELATLRAVLTQSYELDFPFTVDEVVDMAHFVHQEDYSASQLKQFSTNAMQTLGVSHLAKQCFTRLSGGEKQRTQLARVLCQLQPSLAKNKSAYLLIDEPTSSLDLFHQYEVMAQAKAIALQGAGVVAVIHDLSLAASFADRIYMMNNGRVVAHGSPEHVLTQARMKEIYNVDAKLQTNLKNILPHIILADRAC